ncbi:MAG: 50S ribosomal protein L5, partial [Hyphomicrobiaceae bacterium]|nr:50S ribosomal protein L5 [Hyphomicrobiaceae bacterium]
MAKESAPQKPAKGQAPAGKKSGKEAKSAKTAEAKPAKPRAPKGDYKPRMKRLYEDVVRKAMTEKYAYKNPMQVPRLEKIVVNMGVGEAVNDRKKVDAAASDLALLSGQRPVVTRARKS